MYSAMCSNRESLFRLGAGEAWQCELDEAGYGDLRDWLLPEPHDLG